MINHETKEKKPGKCTAAETLVATLELMYVYFTAVISSTAKKILAAADQYDTLIWSRSVKDISLRTLALAMLRDC